MVYVQIPFANLHSFPEFGIILLLTKGLVIKMAAAQQGAAVIEISRNDSPLGCNSEIQGNRQVMRMEALHDLLLLPSALLRR
ncbi:hypothetical protein D3C73_1512240 [compost metagenome]